MVKQQFKIAREVIIQGHVNHLRLSYLTLEKFMGKENTLGCERK